MRSWLAVGFGRGRVVSLSERPKGVVGRLGEWEV